MKTKKFHPEVPKADVHLKVIYYRNRKKDRKLVRLGNSKV